VIHKVPVTDIEINVAYCRQLLQQIDALGADADIAWVFYLVTYLQILLPRYMELTGVGKMDALSCPWLLFI
jgi:hypothetical protein